MNKDEALRLALEALRKAMQGNLVFDEAMEAFKAIEAALEAKDEPDKYAMDIECTQCGAKQSGVLTVHTTPPKQEAKDEEITEIFSTTKGLDFYLNFARAIEAAHGIKGEA